MGNANDTIRKDDICSARAIPRNQIYMMRMKKLVMQVKNYHTSG